MQVMASLLMTYITPETVRAALYGLTFVFVCAGLGRKSRCGLIFLAITALFSFAWAALRVSVAGTVAEAEWVYLLGYAAIGLAAIITFWHPRVGILVGGLLLLVEGYQGITQGAVLVAAAKQGFHDGGGALSAQEVSLWCLAWCLFSAAFAVVYCLIMGISRTFLKRTDRDTGAEYEWPSSPLPWDLTLEEIMPATEEKMLAAEEKPVASEEKPLAAEEALPIPVLDREKPTLTNEEKEIGAEILRYKHLLDEGLITEEVFRERKEELMSGLSRG